VNHQFDVFEHYNVDKYMTAFGLSVSKLYRRRGIATEILKARVPLGRAFGIKVTSTVFTAIGSQMSAANAGFVENYSIE
jgi:GNAT superfamily N-acetyltransferase